jgi:hypothetical protein
VPSDVVVVCRIRKEFHANRSIDQDEQKKKASDRCNRCGRLRYQVQDFPLFLQVLVGANQADQLQRNSEDACDDYEACIDLIGNKRCNRNANDNKIGTVEAVGKVPDPK